MEWYAGTVSRGMRDKHGIALPTVLGKQTLLPLLGASAIALATQGVETSMTSDSA